MGERHGGVRWGSALLLGGLLLLASGSAAAEIYRCTVKGKISFRDKPCAPNERQTRLSQSGALAGCYTIDDSPIWDGGSGSWLVRIGASGADYELREIRSAEDKGETGREVASVPLRRATLEELDTVAAQMRLKVTSGFVLQLPATDGKVYGLFNSWDDAGRLRLVGNFSFVNGYALRAACP